MYLLFANWKSFNEISGTSLSLYLLQYTHTLSHIPHKTFTSLEPHHFTLINEQRNKMREITIYVGHVPIIPRKRIISLERVIVDRNKLHENWLTLSTFNIFREVYSRSLSLNVLFTLQSIKQNFIASRNLWKMRRFRTEPPST